MLPKRSQQYKMPPGPGAAGGSPMHHHHPHHYQSGRKYVSGIPPAPAALYQQRGRAHNPAAPREQTVYWSPPQPQPTMANTYQQPLSLARPQRASQGREPGVKGVTRGSDAFLRLHIMSMGSAALEGIALPSFWSPFLLG